MISTLMWQPNRFANGTAIVSKLALITCAYLLLSGLSPLFGAYETDSIPYGLTYPSGIFNEGDTVTIIIWAGDANTALEDVIGFDLSFELTTDAEFPTSISPDFSNSWITDGQEMEMTTTLNSTERTIEFDGHDVALTKEGDGEIARFSLICASNGLSAEGLLVNAGGGVVIQIDDIGMRRGIRQEAALPDVRIFPNPNPGTIYRSHPEIELSHWVLRDLHGKELLKGIHFPIDLRGSKLSQGRYSLALYDQEGNLTHTILSYILR